MVPEGFSGAAPEGFFNGALKGSTTGTPKGLTGGSSEGSTDGTPKSSTDGVTEGTTDGTRKGFFDRALKGFFNGTLMGLFAGAAKGLSDEVWGAFLCVFLCRPYVAILSYAIDRHDLLFSDLCSSARVFFVFLPKDFPTTLKSLLRGGVNSQWLWRWMRRNFPVGAFGSNLLSTTTGQNIRDFIS